MASLILLNPTPTVSEYLFSESSGTTAADTSGNGRPITVAAGALGAVGHIGGGLNAAAAASAQDIGPATMASRTVMCWIRQTTNGGIQAVVAGAATGTTNEALYVSGGRVGRYDANGALDVTGPTVNAVGTWFHVAWSTGPAGLTIFLNGVAEATNVTTSSYGLASRFIGTDAAGNNLSAAIDDLRVYDRQLSAAQVVTAMNSTAGATTAGASTLTLTPAVASSTPKALTTTLGPVTISLSPAGSAAQVVALAPAAVAGVVALTPAGVATTARVLTPTPQAVTVSLTPVPLAVSTRPVAAISARPYFPLADWLWSPIPASPTLDPNSTTWAGYLGATGTQHIANLREFGVNLQQADASTPRYTVPLGKAVEYGYNPLSGKTVPIQAGTTMAGTLAPSSGGDSHLSIADTSTDRVWSLWQAIKTASSPDAWGASYAGLAPLSGDGRENDGSSTASALSRYAGVIRAADLTAAVAANGPLPYAIFCSSDVSATTWRYPASKSDASANNAGVATPIPLGTRLQLDPTINVDAIAGITAAEKVIAKTLQTRGAYVGDKGGARLAFLFELQQGTAPGPAYSAAGLTFDYFDMSHIPWGSMRSLATWDGSGAASTVTLTPATVITTAKALTPTSGPVTVTLTPASTTATARPLTPAPQPVTLTLAPAQVSTATVPLPAAPGPVSVALSPATMTAGAVPVVPASVGAATLTPALISTSGVQVAPQPQAVTVTLSPASVAAAARPLTPAPQSVTVALTPASVSVGAAGTGTFPGPDTFPGGNSYPANYGVSPSPGAVSVSFTPASLSVSVTALTVSGGVVLVPAAISSTSRPVLASPGAVSVSLSPAAVLVSGRALTPTPGAVTVSLTPAAVVAQAVALNGATGVVTVNLAPVVLAAIPQPLAPAALASTVALAPAAASASARLLSPVPGSVSVTLAPVPVQVQAQTLGAGAGAVTVQLATLTVTVSTRPTSPSLQAVTVALAVALLGVQGVPLAVVPGPVSVGLSSISVLVALLPVSAYDGSVSLGVPVRGPRLYIAPNRSGLVVPLPADLCISAPRVPTLAIGSAAELLVTSAGTLTLET